MWAWGRSVLEGSWSPSRLLDAVSPAASLTTVVAWLTAHENSVSSEENLSTVSSNWENKVLVKWARRTSSLDSLDLRSRFGVQSGNVDLRYFISSIS